MSCFKAYNTNIQYSTKYRQQFLDVYNQVFYWIFLEHRTIVGDHALGGGCGGVEGRVQVICNSVQLVLTGAPFPSLEVFSAPATSFPSLNCTAFILESDSKQVIKHTASNINTGGTTVQRVWASMLILREDMSLWLRQVSVSLTVTGVVYDQTGFEVIEITLSWTVGLQSTTDVQHWELSPEKHMLNV